MPILSMPCLECERLREEEIEALLQHEDASDALAAALATLGPKEVFDEAGLQRWKALDAEVEASRERLRLARRKASEHRSMHYKARQDGV